MTAINNQNAKVVLLICLATSLAVFAAFSTLENFKMSNDITRAEKSLQRAQIVDSIKSAQAAVLIDSLTFMAKTAQTNYETQAQETEKLKKENETLSKSLDIINRALPRRPKF